MKRFFSLLLALSFLCTSLTLLTVQANAIDYSTSKAEAASTDIVFEDVADNFWGKADIDWAVANGITNGTSLSTFVPDGQLTRAQFVTFLSRLAEKMDFDVVCTQNEYPFADVNPYVFYGTPANWAFEQGIVTGAGKDAKGQELFMPEQNITRQEMAVMMDRMLNGLLGVTLGPSDALKYPDAAALADWAVSAAPTMQYTALIRGRPNGSFDPTGLATRAEAVTVVRRLYDLIIPKTCKDQDGANYDGINRSRMFRLDMLNTYANEPNGVLILNEGDSAAAGTGAYTCGRFTVTAAVEEDGQILLESPDAAEAFQSFDLSAYTEKDGNMHTYDLIWLDNNMYVFFVDGKEVHRIGDEYIAPVADTLPATLTLSGKMEVEQSAIYRYIDQSPFALHGALSTKGAFLTDAQGERYMLNGLHIFNGGGEVEYASYETMKWLRDDWGIDGIRIASVLDEYGDHTNGIVAGSQEVRNKMMENIYDAVQVATSLNMYIIIDWHGLDEWERYDKQPASDGSAYSRGDPLIYLPEAEKFFDEFSEQFAAQDNIIYELYNEPLDGKAIYPDNYDLAYDFAWDRIKTQADTLIPIIRENDANAFILVGTPSADQQLVYALNDKDFQNKYDNVMFTVHYYAGMEAVKDQLINALNGGLPVYCSEYGIMDPSAKNTEAFREWCDILQQYQVGNMFFMMARGEDDSSFCILKNDVTALSGWTEDDLTAIGKEMRQYYRACAGIEP